MFKQTWKKYLPVIAILLKRSAAGDQTLNLDEADFLRAAGGRKIKFSFSNVSLNNGRIEYSAKLSPMAKEFVESLMESDLMNVLTKGQQFEFELNNDFQLLIKNVTAPVQDVPVPGA